MWRREGDKNVHAISTKTYYPIEHRALCILDKNLIVFLFTLIKYNILSIDGRHKCRRYNVGGREINKHYVYIFDLVCYKYWHGLYYCILHTDKEDNDVSVHNSHSPIKDAQNSKCGKNIFIHLNVFSISVYIVCTYIF